MNRLARILVVTLLVAPLAAMDQAQFRSRVDAVVVDVAVLTGNRPVAGLQATDFELRDNGVQQQIELFSVENVPVDVTIVFSPFIYYRYQTQDFARLKATLDSMKPGLTSDTRLKVLLAANELREVDVRGQDGTVDLSTVVRSGLLSPQDAIAMTMMRGSSGDRRQLVILFGSVGDRVVIRSAKLVDIASRFDGVVHLVMSGRDDGLKAVAEATGGQLHLNESASENSKTLARVIDSFRKSYVLRYVPKGVATEGWHAIDVKVGRSGRYTVRARKGYWGETKQ